MITVEVCAESVGSAMTAERAGAFRIEFCDNMAEGGTTPSHGLIAEARARVGIKLYPIIRPRGGDFIYDDAEFAVMRRDVEYCGTVGCDGVVIGMLLRDATVDVERCAELVALAKEFGMGVTFHRAFDVCRDQRRALEQLVELGCERVLTSGGRATALEGVDEIRALVEQAAGRIAIMAGSGVSPENAAEIVARTGVGELHGTLRSRYDSPAEWLPEWADYGVWHADEEKIRKVTGI